VVYTNQNMMALIGSIVDEFNFNLDSKHLGILPMGHTAITNYSFLPSLFAGGQLYLAQNFNSIRVNLFDIISEYQINYLQIVPTILFALISTNYDSNKINLNQSLKYVGCGSAPLSLESQIKFFKKFSINVANLYGLSETGPSHFDNPLKVGWKPGSIGFPLSVNKCKILDNDMNEVKVNEVGQIALTGENVFKSYLNNDDAFNKSSFKGYFLTGDLGYKDKTGKYFFVDRIKDLIIKAGVNIVPGEIEEIIFKVIGVNSVAVIGIPDKLFGEEIIAFVEKKDKGLSSEKIFKELKKSLQFLKIPKKIIFLDKLPQGPSGKILKRKLKDLYKNYE
jgi:acyl-CoA synthetase (AMP-forming)/AMP-acid ligase II